MNKQESDILNELWKETYLNQRALAEASGHSLGVVNRSVNNLIRDGYLNEELRTTEKARQEIREKAPKNAVILAAGYGMRMVPINTETPKGLLEIYGEPLIERAIRQLHEAGISEIYVVVGFMKEAYEYLIDAYGVELVVNRDYAVKNNLSSLRLVLEHLSNTYIIPCDIWCEHNPYSAQELYSWYMVSDLVENDSAVRVNRKMELVAVPDGSGGNGMIGIAYLLEQEAAIVRERVLALSGDVRYDGAFWEEALYQKNRMIVSARVVSSQEVVEINTYEQLREMDSHSNQLKSESMDAIARALSVEPEQITEITVLKKGMTNRSFLFCCNGARYIMRIPGEGTDRLIDRAQEAAVYDRLKGRGICDDIVFISPENGYKITKYIGDARVCDPSNEEDVRKCMRKLRAFHEERLTVGHTFDLFRQIEFYEALRGDIPSAYRDYGKTKEQVFSLKRYLDAQPREHVLTHIDAVPDNFLFSGNGAEEEIRLIDWEYAGMQDPHVDIAMFAIYSLYGREQVDRLIDAYFPEGCQRACRIKIYCYLAVCGLLWSNWCEYKRSLGVEFGEYSLRQYRYAKEYYRLVYSELGEEL